MFSGLIRYRGTVRALDERPEGGLTLRVACEGTASEGLRGGDSVAIDGVCLTATAIDADAVTFDVIPETLACTTLSDRKAGDTVNVEYALRFGERVGGHLVYGHVDAPARMLVRTVQGQGERMRIETPVALTGRIALKAFIAIDGISLTVAAVGENWFEIALIPETLARTTLSLRGPGSRVNLEIDPLARYAPVSR